MNFGKFNRLWAFLLAIVLSVAFCFGLASPVMAASDDATMLYNGIEFPNIDTVWTNKEAFPSASIVQNKRTGQDMLLLYQAPVQFASTGSFLYSAPYELYTLTSGAWIFNNSSTENTNFSFAGYVTWTNVNIYYYSSGELYLAASEPQPVEPDEPVVDSVILSVSSSAPYYPGTEVQFNAEVVGTGIVPGSPESTLYWYIHGNTSEDTYFLSESDSGASLHIGNDETATSLEIEAISTYDTTKFATLELTVTYPLEGVQIIPSGVQQFVQSDKQRTIQYQLLLPNGDPYDYQLIEWVAKPTLGHENYFTINDAGLLTIAPDAPVGSGCTIQFAYQSDASALSPVGASVQIISQLDGVIDGITPTPEQSDKADQMEDAIGNAAGKLENNNSSLGDLTPTRPQVNTDLQLDQESLFAVSPLVTNIWSINGLGRMISIVLVVATVAYVFFGKRDG